jgi:hypothetical protein
MNKFEIMAKMEKIMGDDLTFRTEERNAEGHALTVGIMENRVHFVGNIKQDELQSLINWLSGLLVDR